jgi:hypothetical protein
MPSLMDIQPIDRDKLLASMYSTCDDLQAAGIGENMIYVVAGGLQFLITGEDGQRLHDSDLRQMAAHEDAMLFCDLKSGWQGFPNEEDKKNAWTVCNSIAAAFCKAVG